MAPSKFEKHIKESLGKREIMPSAGAWDKVSEGLNNIPRRSKKRPFPWYAVAASLVGLVLVSVFLFNRKDDAPFEEIIVEQPTEVIKENLVEDEILKPFTIEVIANESAKDKSEEFNEVDNKQKVVKIVNGERELASHTDDKRELKNVSISESVIDKVLEIKIAEVLEQVNAMEQNNSAMTNAEVDSLLRKAQEEILIDKIFNQNKSVDAMALLNEVEYELDKSFRDQIFEKLKTGYLKIKTAVADRNN